MRSRVRSPPRLFCFPHILLDAEPLDEVVPGRLVRDALFRGTVQTVYQHVLFDETLQEEFTNFDDFKGWASCMIDAEWSQRFTPVARLTADRLDTISCIVRMIHGSGIPPVSTTCMVPCHRLQKQRSRIHGRTWVGN